MPVPFLPHQPAAVEFLAARQNAFLGDDPGLGKTLEAIAAADKVGATKILVVCPAVARINWQREFLRWQTVERQVVVCATAAQAHAALKTFRTGVLVLSYDGARMAAGELTEQRWDLQILDEAHMLKSPDALRTSAVYGFGCARGPGAITRRAERVWCLSGTPVLSGTHELWTHCRALWTEGGPGWPMTYPQWLVHYTTGFEGTYGYKVTGNRNIEELKEAIAPFLLRRRIEEVMAGMPDLFITQAVVPLDAREAAGINGYAAQVDGLEAHVRQAAEAGDLGWEPGGAHVATIRRMLGQAKARSAAELIGQDLEGGVNKAVVFAHHRDVVLALRQFLGKYGPRVVMGDTPPDKRQAAVDAFQNDPTARVFIGNIGAAGTAITLTASRRVYMVEADWLPELNRQAIARAHRIGQHHSVQATFIVADHPLDDALSATLARRARMVREIESKQEQPV